MQVFKNYREAVIAVSPYYSRLQSGKRQNNRFDLLCT
jgi:hypothetical protein